MRDSFIFYRSFYDAIDSLDDPEDRELCYRAIFEYGFNQHEIELTGVAKAVFMLAKPQLDANYQKYLNGIKPKQSKSKTEAKQKQNRSKTGTNVNVNDNENVNVNVHKGKNADIFSEVPVELREPFMEWVAMRKKIKKPVTSINTVSRALNSLERLSKNRATQIKIINQSIDNCWQSFYELKVDPAKVKPPAYREFPEEERRTEAIGMPDDIREKIKNLF